MGFILILLALAIVVACAALLGTDGLWHNIIAFFNVLVAGLVATNYFEPVSSFLDYLQPSFTYLIDFLVLWALFAVAMVVLRLLTDYASRVKIRFHALADQIGGYVVSLLTAWLLICFTMMTLHTAPLARNFLGGTFYASPEPAEAKLLLNNAPDRQWLSLMHKLSQPSRFGRRATGAEPTDPLFDPHGEFIIKYAARRQAFEKTEGIRVRREWGDGYEQ